MIKMTPLCLDPAHATIHWYKPSKLGEPRIITREEFAGCDCISGVVEGRTTTMWGKGLNCWYLASEVKDQ